MTVGCVSFGCLLPILSLVISLVAYKFSKLSGLENALTYIAAALVIWKLWNDRRTTNKKNRAQKEEYDQAMKEYTRRLAEWEKLFICMRCGHIFKP